MSGGVKVGIHPSHVTISLDGEEYRIARRDAPAALGVVVDFLEREELDGQGRYALQVLEDAIERFERGART